MEKPKFNNKPNQHVVYRYDDGLGTKIHQDFWISRAVAVVGIIIAFYEGEYYILIIKRSNNMLDEKNKYCAPCGYLDFEESCHEAVTREIYEETSLYLSDIKKFLVFDNDKQPYFINDDPKKDKRQNVSFVYVMYYEFENNTFPIEIEKFHNNETAQVKWMKISEFYNNNLDWAFNHNQRIETAIQFLKKNNYEII